MKNRSPPAALFSSAATTEVLRVTRRAVASRACEAIVFNSVRVRRKKRPQLALRPLTSVILTFDYYGVVMLAGATGESVPCTNAAGMQLSTVGAVPPRFTPLTSVATGRVT